MSLADAVAGVLLVALIAYGVLGGADFGGGVWDALARGPRKEAQRAAIAHAMGPVWEANHVWLVFVVVILFTAFPDAWAALTVALFGPLRLVLVGIVLRGVAFVFRAYAPETGGMGRRFGLVFGVASVVTPLLLGASVGAVSAGRVRIVAGEVQALATPPWLSPLSFATALAALSLCAYLAAVFLCVETTGELREDFRARALGSGAVVGCGAALTLPLIDVTAPHLWAGLTRPTVLPVVAGGVLAAVVSLGALARRRFHLARAAAVAQVALVLAGWGLAQHPWLVWPDVTLAAAAAPDATLRFLLASLPFGLAIIGPSLWLLYRVFHRGGAEHA